MSKLVFVLLIMLTFLAIVPVIQAQEILPLNQVKSGDRGYGLTVFKDEMPDRFDFEVIDVTNDGIWVLLSGGPTDERGNEILAETRILQGMSGSPLYVNDKLIGGIAATYGFQKKSYALATPIEFTEGFVEVLGSPNKFIYTLDPISRAKLPRAEIHAGDTYVFCDYWGSDSFCGAGTVTLVDPKNPNLIYTLGHPGGAIGNAAIPFWKGRVTAIIAKWDISHKMVAPVGPMLGTVVFDSSFGQIAKTGVFPEFFKMSLSLENYFSSRLDEQYFFAYTPRTAGNISYVIAGIRQLIGGSPTLDAEIRVDAKGFKQVYSYGSFTKATAVSSIVKMFLEDGSGPTMENIAIRLRVRPEYRVLTLKNAASKAKKDPSGQILLDLSIAAIGQREWINDSTVVINEKYLNKELRIAGGEELAAKMIPNLLPNAESVELLNKISDKNALYLYYFDQDAVKPAKPESGGIMLIFGADSTSTAVKPFDLLGAGADGSTEKKTGDWNSQPEKSAFDILAKIELPGQDYLIEGDIGFTPVSEPDNKTNAIKEKKKIGRA